MNKEEEEKKKSYEKPAMELEEGSNELSFWCACPNRSDSC